MMEIGHQLLWQQWPGSLVRCIYVTSLHTVLQQFAVIRVHYTGCDAITNCIIRPKYKITVTENDRNKRSKYFAKLLTVNLKICAKYRKLNMTIHFCGPFGGPCGLVGRTKVNVRHTHSPWAVISPPMWVRKNYKMSVTTRFTVVPGVTIKC